jgi:transposase
VLNIDETGHKENGQKFWTWCFRAQVYTFFRIDKSRGSEVLVEVLGEEFNGVLGGDYFNTFTALRYRASSRKSGAGRRPAAVVSPAGWRNSG